MTYDELRRVVRCLDEPRLRRLLVSCFNQSYAPEAEVETKHWVLACLGDWVEHLGVFSELQVVQIVSFVSENDVWWDPVVRHHDERPALTLAIADARWVSFKGQDGFFDARDSVTVHALTEPAVSHYMCDAVALIRRVLRSVDRLRRAGGASDHVGGEAGVQPGRPGAVPRPLGSGAE